MGQYFDRLCQVAEQCLLPAEIRKLLAHVHLFEFPGPAEKILPTVEFDSAENVKFITDLFFLPFPVIAIEDAASVIVLADTDQEALGTRVDRFFLEFRWLQSERHKHPPPGQAAIPSDMNDCALAVWGFVKDVGIAEEPDDSLPPETPPAVTAWSLAKAWHWTWQLVRHHRIPTPLPKPPPPPRMKRTSGERLRLAGRAIPGRALLFQIRGRRDWKVHFRYDEDGIAQLVCASAPNALLAFEEVAMYNLPSRWIVKKSHVKAHTRPTREGYLPRTSERPVYLLMSLHDFSVKIHHGPAGTLRVTHGRRAHPRLLSSAKFTHKHGQWIRVRASVVGPTKGVDEKGNWEYEVLTDR